MDVLSQFEKELELLQSGGLKDSPLRQEYEENVRRLAQECEQLLAEGIPAEEAARRLHARHRQLGKEYKDAAPPLFREYILYATEKKYGDPLGPDYV